MQIDSYTLLVASCAMITLFGSVFLVLWMRDRSSIWLLWWGIPIMANGIGLTMYMRPAWDTDFLALALGNALRIGMLTALWIGIRLFQGQRPPYITSLAIIVTWIILCAWPPFLTNMTARIVFISIAHGFVAALVALDLWNARQDDLRSRMPLTAVFASFTLFMAVRTMIAGIAPFPWGAGPIDSLSFALFAWMMVAHALFASIFFLTMTLERREQQQRSYAMSDPLTALMNRRAFGEFAQRLARRSATSRDPLALLVLDLDGFKQVNDRHGHEVGDRLLQAFARVAEEHTRAADQLFRMGGEEFCFVLPNTVTPAAVTIAERIRKAFAETAVETFNDKVGTTVSIGVAATRLAIDLDVLLAAGDAALYQAKAQGRNRTIVAEPSALTMRTPDHPTTQDRRRA